MPRNKISIILSMIFLLFLVTPTVIAIVDDSIDISIFYAMSEEEENGIEKNKIDEVLILQANTLECFFGNKKVKRHSAYFFKNYQKPHLNLISPPPDLG
jgi:hypothetical protein